jgi:hypothetical protein
MKSALFGSVVLLGLIFCQSSIAAGEDSDPRWLGSYKEGQLAAKQFGKPIFLVFR